ncbi:hypothetical protein [Burkholderia sp. D-99]|uniref:TubC N-terminal docking domain-related protein n=1 Tax=Burkholderia sp. D-99 TaxID=2717316 RepID=UPI00141FFF4D|nr:hypothetical protein [Burkholderia sp. D-99]NHV29299.1 hypothetical protein [Burkholderia sp. D-99]
MNAIAIVNKAKAMGIRLSSNGDKVKLRGPADAIAVIKPEIAAHKSEILAHLRAAEVEEAETPADCVGALREPGAGLYLPWGPYLDSTRLKSIQRELFKVVDELARLEHWRDDTYDLVIGAIERQPLSTLLPDLGYFRDRLQIARAENQARQAAAQRAWRFNR